MVPAPPRVTAILQACGLGMDLRLPRERREFYLARGRALHRAVELDAVGALDESSVHPEIAGGLDAYRKFCAATGHEPLCSEPELVHPQWGFMGHPDRIGLTNRRMSLIDWKASFDPHAVRLQLAAYGMLWRDTHPETKIEEYLAVKLGFDGTWSVHPIDPRPHEQTFLAALVVYRALEERRRLLEIPPP